MEYDWDMIAWFLHMWPSLIYDDYRGMAYILLFRVTFLYLS